jgi:tetratricopeptide (TPR) repeat protein
MDLKNFVGKSIVLFWFAACVFVSFIPFTLHAQVYHEEPAWVYEGRGDRYLKEGEPGKAIVEYKKALIGDSGSKRTYPEVNMKLAKIYLSEGLYDLALSYIENAQDEKQELQISDQIYDIWYTKAEIYIGQGRYDAAMFMYEEIIEKDPIWTRYKKQDIYVINGDFIDDPVSKKKFAAAYFNLGKIKYDFQNYDNAIPLFKVALAYGFHKEESLKYLVNCYKKLNNLALADRAQSLYADK